ncbi:YciI family protein [Actinoplanes sp. NPDC048988]|uniref:YciI family protein n=1 Tax=Actinoplanes sp. NPDC048988 TaxID=3363901 RepID=UPI00370F919D
MATDGPYAEILGGFYLIEAGDLDEVQGLAALLPEVRDTHSAVEIRPMVEHGLPTSVPPAPGS